MAGRDGLYRELVQGELMLADEGFLAMSHKAHTGLRAMNFQSRLGRD
jgi:hypothetical protein